MTTANATIAELLEGLSETIEIHDEDGQPETITVTATWSDENESYTIECVDSDGDLVDSDESFSFDDAALAITEFSRQLMVDDRRRERDRIRDARKYAAECLSGTAAELSGTEKDAVRLLGLLVASGKAEAALNALRRVVK